MGEVVRNLRKQGAKNREINDSVKEAMALILKNREIKKQEEQATRAKNQPEEAPLIKDDLTGLPFDINAQESEPIDTTELVEPLPCAPQQET